MDTAITVKREDDFAGFRLEQSPTGFIRSPWFSFELDPSMGPFDFRSRYHQIIEASKRAFAERLGLGENAVRHGQLIVTQLNDNSDPRINHWWRISTAMPMKLPKPVKPMLPENEGAIEI